MPGSIHENSCWRYDRCGVSGRRVILKTGVSIQGLTTAACIWIVSAIGLAIGAGQYVAGITGFAITFISLWFLRLMEIKIPTMAYKYVTVVTDNSGDEKAIASIFQDRGFKINKMDYDIEITKNEKKYILTVSAKDGISMQEVIDAVTNLKLRRNWKYGVNLKTAVGKVDLSDLALFSLAVLSEMERHAAVTV